MGKGDSEVEEKEKEKVEEKEKEKVEEQFERVRDLLGRMLREDRGRGGKDRGRQGQGGKKEDGGGYQLQQQQTEVCTSGPELGT